MTLTQTYFLIVLNLTEEPYQYLYSEGDQIHLLNLETFEEIEMPASRCEGGDKAVSLLEGIAEKKKKRDKMRVYLIVEMYRCYACHR